MSIRVYVWLRILLLYPTWWGGLLGFTAFNAYGVGFCVARFELKGNARASMRGTSDGTVPTLFCIWNNRFCQGNWGAEENV